MTHVRFPLGFDTAGRTATADDPAYLRALIEEVLFTRPGERVNRPDFGSGLLQMVLAPADEVLAATTELTVQSALQRWLGDLIDVQSTSVRAEGERLVVEIAYAVRGSDRTGVEEFGWSL